MKLFHDEPTVHSASYGSFHYKHKTDILLTHTNEHDELHQRKEIRLSLIFPNFQNELISLLPPYHSMVNQSLRHASHHKYDYSPKIRDGIDSSTHYIPNKEEEVFLPFHRQILSIAKSSDIPCNHDSLTNSCSKPCPSNTPTKIHPV